MKIWKVSNILLNCFYVCFFLLFFAGMDTKGIYQYTSEIMALSSVILIVGYFVNHNKFSIVSNKLIVFLYFVIFGYIIAEYYGWSYYPDITKIYIIRYIFYAPLVLICIRTENILKLISWSKYYLILIALVFVAQYPSKGVNGSFLGSYQNVAAAMCFGLLFCIADILLKKEYTWKDIFYFLILLGTLLMTGKRTFAVIPCVILCVFGLFRQYEISQKLKWKRLLKILIVCLVIGGSILIIKPDLLSSITRLMETKEDSGLNGRSNLWNLAIYHWQNNKIKGIGLGSYATFITNNLNFTYQNFGVQRAYAVHNIYLQLLAETGIIGTSLYVFFFGYNLIWTIKTYRLEHVKENIKWRHCSLISLFIQIWFIAYGFTGNPLFVPSQFYVYLFAIMVNQSVCWELKHIREE